MIRRHLVRMISSRCSPAVSNAKEQTPSWATHITALRELYPSDQLVGSTVYRLIDWLMRARVFQPRQGGIVLIVCLQEKGFK